jgi:hypothetical protein
MDEERPSPIAQLAHAETAMLEYRTHLDKQWCLLFEAYFQHERCGWGDERAEHNQWLVATATELLAARVAMDEFPAVTWWRESR